jgi:lysophospholipid acyltransferase (LPLAT)-like uncharacterized protein
VRRPLRQRGRFAAAARSAFGALGAAYIRLCWSTTRWTVERAPEFEAMGARRCGFIAAFWHSRLIFSPLWVLPGRTAWAMISANRDGDVISAAVARFGVELIRGSSGDPRKPDKDKQGRAASVAALRRLREGDIVAIAVDGPRGPVGAAKPGVAALSLSADCPVAPIAFATRRAIALRSWDRFLIPIPFDRGALLFGAPLEPEGRDHAAHLNAVEQALAALTARADALAGRPPAPVGAGAA